MQIIPLIKIKDNKIFDSTFSSAEEAIKKIDENQIIYILDFDGIENGDPNLGVVQKLSLNKLIWVDTGPRNLGDVFDAFMEGAVAITLRKNLFQKINIQEIKDLTENSIYMFFESQNNKEALINDPVFTESYGIVFLEGKEKIDFNVEYSTFHKMKEKNRIFIYEKNKENFEFWKNFGVEGILVDIDKFEEMKDGF